MHAACSVSHSPSSKGDPIVASINNKLASYLSAKDRLCDAADMQSLIKRLKLPLKFANRLAPKCALPAVGSRWNDTCGN